MHIHQTNQHYLFNNLPSTLEVGRYHSWVVNKNTLPANFAITATDDEGNIMAMQHQLLPLVGVQFHPESILTPFGETILRNWLLNKLS
jgi:anthranilate synthase component 2